jgi:hypothetical protein
VAIDRSCWKSSNGGGVTCLAANNRLINVRRPFSEAPQETFSPKRGVSEGVLASDKVESALRVGAAPTSTGKATHSCGDFELCSALWGSLTWWPRWSSARRGSSASRRRIAPGRGRRPGANRVAVRSWGRGAGEPRRWPPDSPAGASGRCARARAAPEAGGPSPRRRGPTLPRRGPR